MCDSLSKTQTSGTHFHICGSGLTWIKESCDQLCRRPFFKSRKTTALILPRSILYAQVTVASRRAVTVE